MNIKMIRRGREYRVTVADVSLRFAADADKQLVWVHSQQRLIGGFDLARFGGRLDPASIQQFIIVGLGAAALEG
ncbi:hypothetical protein [Mycolicibacterium aubagnense]|uniref:hypothetical protein n=1 Tax=Mycolicibacterium aubagnense TaxID=319707 RepID=UPI0010FD22AC|nr:hypothetical protein [Mycolicibacterium aubagnense]TLH64246.1 hypothetical protein C1S80_12600 [Mycolicibacterium aubagnense]